MRRAKITIVGAGNVGATTAHWCAAAELGDIDGDVRVRFGECCGAGLVAGLLVRIPQPVLERDRISLGLIGRFLVGLVCWFFVGLVSRFLSGLGVFGIGSGCVAVVIVAATGGRYQK